MPQIDQPEGQIMTTRKWMGTATGVIAIVLAASSVAWACGNFASGDMTIKNATDEPWDGGDDVGKNWSDCAMSRWLSNPHGCYRKVTVEGKNFQNDTEQREITEVTLWWLDEPYYAAGLGGPNGAAERLEAHVCETKGVKLGTFPVVNKQFTANDVWVAPRDNTTEDGTPRLGYIPGVSPPDSGKYYYGTNAICATWTHWTSPTVSHQGSVGNSYNIYP